MYSDKFKTTILFNGEIYNHQALRNELIKKESHLKRLILIQRPCLWEFLFWFKFY